MASERRPSNSLSSEAPAHDLLLPLRERPQRAALLCDIDGTIAPIVIEPHGAVVPAETRNLLERLDRELGLVACISGRRAEDARRVVGLPSLTYVGNHGLELLAPGGDGVEVVPGAAESAQLVSAFAKRSYTPELRDAGVRLEDKGPIWSFHWRNATDERSARAALEQIARSAGERGLVPHWGRKVLEVRPPLHVDKGIAITRVLERADLDAALYGGDDLTDVDAFRALRVLLARGALSNAVCVGVASEEAPAPLIAEADIVVEGSAGFRELLAELAAA